MGITDDASVPDKFVFPAGTVIPPGGYLVLYANNPTGDGDLHTGFSLNGGGDGVFLFRLDGGTRRWSTPSSSACSCPTCRSVAWVATAIGR